MCQFKIEVQLCGCRDSNCTQRPSTLNQNESQFLRKTGGHVFKIVTYFRTGPLCIDSFSNEDPNRLTLYYGMDPKNANSKQDCKNRTFKIDPNSKHLDVTCDECKKKCTQPPLSIWDRDIETLGCITS
ncbi:hypothetical protein PT974_03880 [Cladobotryum mycophilum]|uniref:Uncharacterized protein n=1 Tax=Cladobotryum mycophilum TaxID=491253 RepID=A0ABR0STJ1_9HYPO